MEKASQYYEEINKMKQRIIIKMQRMALMLAVVLSIAIGVGTQPAAATTNVAVVPRSESSVTDEANNVEKAEVQAALQELQVALPKVSNQWLTNNGWTKYQANFYWQPNQQQPKYPHLHMGVRNGSAVEVEIKFLALTFGGGQPNEPLPYNSGTRMFPHVRSNVNYKALFNGEIDKLNNNLRR